MNLICDASNAPAAPNREISATQDDPLPIAAVVIIHPAGCESAPCYRAARQYAAEAGGRLAVSEFAPRFGPDPESEADQPVWADQLSETERAVVQHTGCPPMEMLVVPRYSPTGHT